MRIPLAREGRGASKARSSSRRCKLLFLAHPFPPANLISCVRTWNIAKYLGRLGWEVTVVTPHPSVWRHSENSEIVAANVAREGIKRILTGHGWRSLAPDVLRGRDQRIQWLAGGICRRIARQLGIGKMIGWVKAAEQSCALLTPGDVDVILATGRPFEAFGIAKRLSERLGRPYVLDYRDLWTDNAHWASANRSDTAQREARLLARCAAGTIVSPAWRLAMARRFGLEGNLHVVPNGYSQEDLVGVKSYNFGHFAIVYAGTFYPPKRVITPVMAALKRLEGNKERRGDTWRFHYYGQQEDHVYTEARRFGVQQRVVLHGLVPRNEALSAIKGAGISVVIASVFDEATLVDQGIVTGKIFEAVGMGRPILLVAPPGSDARSVVESTGISQAFSGKEIDSIAAFLRCVMDGSITVSKGSDIFAWPKIAEKLDNVLREVVTRH